MDVIIDGVNLGAEYGLEWYDIVNDAPVLFTNYCDVPGRHGSIDLSEAVSGGVTYSDRNIRLFFLKDDRSPASWASTCSELYARFHGRRLKIILGNDPDFFYIGRLSCQGTKSTYVSSSYEISAKCEPFKYKNALSTKVCAASSAGTQVIFSNLFAPCKPYFETTSEISVQQGGSVYGIPAGGVTIPEIAFGAGNNLLKFIGSGSVTVKWQEGTL